MKKTLACLLALLCLFALFSCDKTEDTPAPGEDAPAPSETFSPDIPEYRYIAVYHYKKNAEGAFESLDDCVSYNVSQGDANIAVWQELLREIEDASFCPTTEAFDYDEYYDVNIYLAGSVSQYALSFSKNGVCDVERQRCTVASGGFSFARLAEYFAILKG